MQRRVAHGRGSLARFLAAAALVTPLAACGDATTPAPAPAPAAAPTAPTAPALPADAPKLEFRDHAPALGMAPQFRGPRTRQPAEDLAGGIAVADFDGDGRPDVLVVGTGALPQGGASKLYRNETQIRGGALELKDVTKEAGLPGLVPGMGAAVADTDGDADLDLLLTCVGAVRMLRNDGGLTFSDVTNTAGLGDVSGWCTGATFGDADGDGDLDLYVGRYLNDGGEPASNLLFRNDGHGGFEGGEALAKEFGIGCPGGRSFGALFGDFDRDGMPDLCVAGETAGVSVFRATTTKDGDRGFATAGWQTETGVAALAAADADADGDDDLLVAARPETEIRQYRNASPTGGGLDFGYVMGGSRSGDGRLIARSGVSAWSLDLADFDLDGRPDLFAAGGSASEDPLDSTRLGRQRSLVFWNAGEDPAAQEMDRGFLDAGAAWGAGWSSPRVLRGGAAADLDGDGDLDVVLGALDGPPAVLINEGDRRGRPLCVALRAPAPNTFGVGARVTVTCDGRTQSREMRSSPGYLSAGPLTVHFGLGDAKGPATVSVRWPDGTTSENVVDAAERWPVITKSGKR